MSNGMTSSEIMRLVNRYIGVSGGYLADFSYRTHEEFYPEFCNLDCDPNSIQGTTRERFIQILRSAPPVDQAKIIRGVLARFQVGAPNAPSSRIEDLASEFRGIAARLEGAAPVAAPDLQSGTRAVETALADAEVLLKSSGPLSAVDRVHTALHGYLEVVAADAGLSIPKDASSTFLFGLIRKGHPKLCTDGGQAEHIAKLWRQLGAILDALQPVRDRGSLAHPNDALLGEPEAMLVVNVVRSVLRYLKDKLGE